MKEVLTLCLVIGVVLAVSAVFTISLGSTGS